MSDSKPTHEDVVTAVRKALLDDLKQVKQYHNSDETRYTGSSENILNLAKAYEHIMNAGTEY